MKFYVSLALVACIASANSNAATSVKGARRPADGAIPMITIWSGNVIPVPAGEGYSLLVQNAIPGRTYPLWLVASAGDNCDWVPQTGVTDVNPLHGNLVLADGYADFSYAGSCLHGIAPVYWYTWTDSNVSPGGTDHGQVHQHWKIPGAEWDYPPDYVNIQLGTITSSSVDWTNSKITVVGRADEPVLEDKTDLTFASGNIGFTFSDSAAGMSAPRISSQDQYIADGSSKALKFNRTKLPAGRYNSLRTELLVSTPALSSTMALNPIANVEGVIHYTQYNVPKEDACTGSAASIWIVDSISTCNFTAYASKADFVSQTKLNGTGKSISMGLLKSGAAVRLIQRCTPLGTVPEGATNANSFLQVTKVTGSCNSELVANSSDATLNGSCTGIHNLVTLSNVNFGIRKDADTCPACGPPYPAGTVGHIDSFTDSDQCSGHSVGDLGNYWTLGN